MQIVNEKVELLTEKTDEELLQIRELDVPLELTRDLKRMPQTKSSAIPDNVLSFLSEKRAVRLICFAIVVLIVTAGVQVALSACCIKYENTFINGLFEICKVVVTVVLGYLFGSRTKKKES